MALIPNLFRMWAANMVFSLAFHENILIFKSIGAFCCIGTLSTFIVFNGMLPPVLLIHEKYMADRDICRKSKKKDKK